ncbi:MAG: hypothetical protein AB7L92_03945 [Alphaproteobacteria bacterium]
MARQWTSKSKKPTIAELIDPVLKEFGVYPEDAQSGRHAGHIPGKAYVGAMHAIAQQQPYYDRAIELFTGVLGTSAAAVELNALLRNEGKCAEEARDTANRFRLALEEACQQLATAHKPLDRTPPTG